MDAKTSEWRAGPNVCRCCLSEGCYKDISTEYFWMGKREVYAEMLSETLSLTISYSQSGGPNSNSRLICELCISRLRDASDFKRQVLECEKTFMQHLDSASSSLQDIEVPAEPIDDVKLERVKQEKRVSDDDFDDRCDFDDDDDDLDDQPLMNLATKIPKKESVDLMDLLDNSRKVTEKRKSSTKTKTTSAKKTKITKIVKKEQVKASVSKVAAAVAKSEKKKKDTEFDENVKKKGVRVKQWLKDKEFQSAKEAENYISSLEEFKKVTKYSGVEGERVNFRCCLGQYRKNECPVEYYLLYHANSSKVSLFKTNEEHANHMSANRGIDRAVKKTITQMYNDGIRKPNTIIDQNYDATRSNAETIISSTTAYPFRVNDKSILCVYCQELFEDPEDFRSHMDSEHDYFSLKVAFHHLPKNEFIKADLTNLRCRLCRGNFDSLESVLAHLDSEHNKKTDPKGKLGVMPYLLQRDVHNCAVCEKNFPSLFHLNRHTITHFLSYVCHVCGSSYVATTGLLRHVRSKHQNYEVSCKRCKKVFPTMEAKERHRRTQKSCLPYCCPKCQERFLDWKSRKRHMEVAHGQSKRTYRCVDCNIEFTNENSYYEHFKLHHSEDCAVCKHCGLKFLSPYRLKRHIAKHNV